MDDFKVQGCFNEKANTATTFVYWCEQEKILQVLIHLVKRVCQGPLIWVSVRPKTSKLLVLTSSQRIGPLFLIIASKNFLYMLFAFLLHATELLSLI